MDKWIDEWMDAPLTAMWPGGASTLDQPPQVPPQHARDTSQFGHSVTWGCPAQFVQYNNPIAPAAQAEYVEPGWDTLSSAAAAWPDSQRGPAQPQCAPAAQPLVPFAHKAHTTQTCSGLEMSHGSSVATHDKHHHPAVVVKDDSDTDEEARRDVHIASTSTMPCTTTSAEMKLHQEPASNNEALDLLQQVDKTLRGLDYKGSASFQQQLKQLARKATGLRDELATALTENQTLHMKWSLANTQVELVEREKVGLEQEAELRPAPLFMHAQMLGRPSSQRPPASGAMVSVLELPPPNGWDKVWCARVRGLQTLDLLHLNRQFLKRCGLLLPKVEVFQDAPAKLELEELCSRYHAFNQQVMRLAPAPWHDCVNYNCDTMEPMSEQVTSAYIWRYQNPQLWSPSDLLTLKKIRADFFESMSRLRQQQAQLQQQLHQLVGRGMAVAGFRFDTRDDVDVSSLAAALDRNLQQQNYLHRKFVHAISRTVSPVSMAKTKLLLYPVAINGQLLPDQL